MKSYNGLYSRMMETAEIEESIKEAAKNKRSRKPVQRALEDTEGKALKVKAEIEKPGGWRPPRHKEIPCQDGSHKKLRMIQKPRWDNEQIVHHKPNVSIRYCKRRISALAKRKNTPKARKTK